LILLLVASLLILGYNATASSKNMITNVLSVEAKSAVLDKNTV